MSPVFFLALGASFIGLAPIFVKLIGEKASLIAFYRTLWGSLFLGLFLLKNKKNQLFSLFSSPSAWHLKACGLGLWFGLDLFVWNQAVLWAGAGISTILANTQVFYLSLIEHLFYKKRLTPLFWFASCIAFGGVLLLTLEAGTSITLSAKNPHFFKGILLALSTGIIYTFYLLGLRYLEQSSPYSTSTNLFLILLSATSSSFLFLLLSSTSLSLPLEKILYTVGLGFFSQTLGWLLITRYLPKVPISITGLVLLLQPIVAVLLSTLLLKEKLSFFQCIGGMLTLTGIYIGNKAQNH